MLLFGAGKKEGDILQTWENTQPSTVLNVCGKMGGLKNEMLLMSQLDLMISMDSANMHIASIFGITTLSIWGATHPKAGFSGMDKRQTTNCKSTCLADLAPSTERNPANSVICAA